MPALGLGAGLRLEPRGFGLGQRQDPVGGGTRLENRGGPFLGGADHRLERLGDRHRRVNAFQADEQDLEAQPETVGLALETIAQFGGHDGPVPGHHREQVAACRRQGQRPVRHLFQHPVRIGVVVGVGRQVADAVLDRDGER